MNEWWMELSGASRVFYLMAAFFSVFFLWQVIGAFAGMTGDDFDADGFGDGDVDFDADAAPDAVDHHDVVESSQAFKILSLRSIVTFFTLFSWGSALYTSQGVPVVKAMGISTIWGLVGMLSIALIFGPWANSRRRERKM